MYKARRQGSKQGAEACQALATLSFGYLLILLVLLTGPVQASTLLDPIDIPEMCTSRAKTLQGGVRELQARWASSLKNLDTALTSQKDVFDYAYRCSKRPSDCTGYFSPQNDFELQIYCDKELLRRLLRQKRERLETHHGRCVKTPQLFFESPFEEDPKYQRECATKRRNHLGLRERVWRKDILPTELAVVANWERDYYATLETTLSQSAYPDALAFALTRLSHDLALASNDLPALKSELKYSAFLSALSFPAHREKGKPLVGPYAKADKYISHYVAAWTQEGLLGPVFNPTTRETQEAFQAYEESKTVSLNLRAVQPLESAPYITHHVDFLSPQLPSTQEQELAVLKGFLPYQFLRLGKAKTLRELQKHPKALFDQLTKGDEPELPQFIDDVILCPNKSYPFVYCSEDYREFRFKHYREWTTQLTQGMYALDFHQGSSKWDKRRYIYDAQLLATLNEALSSVNTFCWNHALAPKDYHKAPRSHPIYVEHGPMLQFLLHQILTTPGLSELFENPFFLKLVEFPSTDLLHQQCFSKGYLFGPRPKATPEYKDDDYYSTINPNYPYLSVSNRLTAHKWRPQDRFYEPTFSLTLPQLQRVEDDIEALMTRELSSVLRAASYKDASDVKVFLRESVSQRLFALLSYAYDHPSQMAGVVIRQYLQQANDRAISQEQLQHYLMIGVIAASVATAFFLPSPAYLVVYKLGAFVVAFGSGAFVSYLRDSQLQNELEGRGRAAVSYNFDSMDSLELIAKLNASIKDNQLSMKTFLALTLATEVAAIVKGVALVRTWANPAVRQTYFRRFHELEKLQRVMTEINPTTGLPEPAKWMTHKFKHALSQATHVNDETYQQFYLSAKAGQGAKFAESHPSLARYFPGLSPKPMVGPNVLFKPLIWGVSKAFQPVLWVTNHAFKLPGFRHLKVYFIEHVLYPLAKKDFLNHKLFLDTVNHALAHGHIRPSELNRRISSMPGFRVEGGRLVWVVTHLRMQQAIRFLHRVLHRNLTRLLDENSLSAEELRELAPYLPRFYRGKQGLSWLATEPFSPELLDHPVLAKHGITAILKYLDPVVKGNLLDDATWTLIFKHQTRPIRSISQCKDFLKSVKFIAQEYGFREQIARLSRGRSVSYEDIVKFLAINIDEIMSSATHVRYKNILRFLRFLDDTPSLAGLNRDEVADEILRLHSFNLREALRNRTYYQDSVRRYTPSTIAQGNMKLKDFQAELIKQEQAISTVFWRRLKSELLKRPHPKDFMMAYDRALYRAQARKMLEVECHLPGSTIRTAPDQLFKGFAQYVSTITNTYGYLINHPPSSPEAFFGVEAMTRLIYEVSVPLIASNLKVNGFIKAKTILSKAASDYTTSLAIGASFMAPYQLLNEFVWEDDTLYAQKLRDMISQAENPQARLLQLYERHPEAQELVTQRTRALTELFEKHYGALLNYSDEELRQWSPERQDAFIQDLYTSFIKAGLIEKFEDDLAFKDGNTLIKNTVEDAFYHNAFANKDASITWGAFGQTFFTLTPKPLSRQFEIRSREWSLVPNFMADSFDRFAFYAAFDLGIDAPLTVIRQHAIRKTLCGLRRLPPVLGVGAASMIYAVYKMAYDPFRFWVRRQTTGH